MQLTMKAARMSAKLTQKQAAEALHIHHNTLSAYENGKRYPSVPFMREMTDLYRRRGAPIYRVDDIFLP